MEVPAAFESSTKTDPTSSPWVECRCCICRDFVTYPGRNFLPNLGEWFEVDQIFSYRDVQRLSLFSTPLFILALPQPTFPWANGSGFCGSVSSQLYALLHTFGLQLPVTCFICNLLHPLFISEMDRKLLLIMVLLFFALCFSKNYYYCCCRCCYQYFPFNEVLEKSLCSY